MVAQFWFLLKRGVGLVVALLASLIIYLVLSPSSDAIEFSILGGVFGAVAFEVAHLLVEAMRWYYLRRDFERMFGADSFGRGIWLVYSSFRMSPAAAECLRGGNHRYPHIEAGVENPDVSFVVREQVSSDEIRGFAYLIEMFTRVESNFSIQRAADRIGDLDQSMVLLGLGGSQKSRQVLEQLPQYGYALGQSNGSLILKDLTTDQPIAVPEPGGDIGYLIRIRPRQHPTRTWVLCAGLGATGSSGAAYFLSKHGRQIPKRVVNGEPLGDKPFLMVLKVKGDVDQSAEVLEVRALIPTEFRPLDVLARELGVPLGNDVHSLIIIRLLLLDRLKKRAQGLSDAGSDNISTLLSALISNNRLPDQMLYESISSLGFMLEAQPSDARMRNVPDQVLKKYIESGLRTIRDLDREQTRLESASGVGQPTS